MVDRAELASVLGDNVTAMTPIAGGDISAAFRAELADGRVAFVKVHDAAPPGMFAAEASGLEWLRPGPLRVPRVLATGDTWLALEWLALSGRPNVAELGRGLAALHRLGPLTFGFHESNYLATLPQDNTRESDWPAFYVERRLRPLMRRAQLGLNAKLDQLLSRPQLFGPPEPPARLHGDLWWGNVASSNGVPVIFDPAVYGGHREIDLAMLALFGDLPDPLVSAYSEIWPLDAEWRDRIALHQLYPLAAHACLFGGAYGSRVAEVLSRYLG